MKKLILSSVAVALSLSSVNAASDEEILSIYGGAPKDVNIKIVERIPVAGLDGFEAVVVEFSKDDFRQEEILFSKGDLIFPEVLNIKEKISYVSDMKEQRKLVNLSKVFNAENEENIIKLGNDKDKPTMLVFTDAECPYCRKEMEQIEERLKTRNIEMVMISVHKDSGHSKSAMIYKDMKTAKTDADKIKILRKYYDDKLPSQEKQAGADNIAKMKALAAKYHAAGVDSVPFIIEKDKLPK